jgi:hypothetical protein
VARVIRALECLSAFFHPSPNSQLPALFAQRAGDWLLLDLGAGWEPGKVRTVVATGRRRAPRRLQGFQCIYRRAGLPAATVVLSQERLECGDGRDQVMDEAMMAAVARTVHALTREISESLPELDWPPQGAGEWQMVIAGRVAGVQHLPGFGPQIQVAVVVFADLVVVIAAHQCSPLRELILGLRINSRPVVSAEGVISTPPTSSPTESSQT